MLHKQLWLPGPEDKLWVYYGPQTETDGPDNAQEHTRDGSWRMIGKWSRRPIFRVLYARAGVDLQLLASELNDPKWSGRFDEIEVVEGKLVVRATNIANWMGRAMWRGQALNEVTGGRLVFEQVLPDIERSKKDV